MPLRRFGPAALAAAVALALYWPAFQAWFQQDDFAWLGLGATVRDLPTLLEALFAPMAQGTIRPLSERGFFLTLHGLFGLDPLPYRICVFVTLFGALGLLSAVARRLTGSELAAWLAPLFWVVNPALARPMVWASAYNQVLCAFFLLAALYLHLRRRFLLEAAAFVAALGSHEIAAVYPAILAVYGRHWQVAARLGAVSAVYVAVRLGLTRVAGTQYAPHFDASLAWAALDYWRWALFSLRSEYSLAAVAALTVGLAAWLVLRRRLVAPAFFFLTLAPVLPLTEHRMEYYLAVPAAGLAIWAAWACADAFRHRALAALAAVLALLYAGGNAAAGYQSVTYYTNRSQAARTIVLGAAHARQVHPNAVVVLAGLDDDLYRATLYHEPFRLYGVSRIQLGPDAGERVRGLPGDKPLDRFLMTAPVLAAALARGEAVVYAWEPPLLRNITGEYFARLRWRPPAGDPRRIDAGDPWFAAQLGPGWYDIDRGIRWMGRRASVRLGGPQSPGAKLIVSGFCPAAQVRTQPLRVFFTINNRPAGEALLRTPGARFESEFPLPPDLHGTASLDVSVEVERTFKAPPDVRELGIVFGSFEIRD